MSLDAATLKQWFIMGALALELAAVIVLALDLRRQGKALKEQRLFIAAVDQAVHTADGERIYEVMRLESRIDRLQKKVEGGDPSKPSGWGDSLDLTKFNWQKPPPF